MKRIESVKIIRLGHHKMEQMGGAVLVLIGNLEFSLRMLLCGVERVSLESCALQTLRNGLVSLSGAYDITRSNAEQPQRIIRA